jgi:hypothetical protein
MEGKRGKLMKKFKKLKKINKKILHRNIFMNKVQ